MDGKNEIKGVSYVIVRLSDEFLYNVIKSPCLENPANEVIIVDNSGNLYFQSVSCAIIEGISRAAKELVVVVKEDVFLPGEWQFQLEESIGLLEKENPEWAFAGCQGWSSEGEKIGHWNDSVQDINLFDKNKFEIVERLSESVLIFKRTRRSLIDINLIDTHYLGLDIGLESTKAKLNNYVIDAPIICNSADAMGKQIDKYKVMFRKVKLGPPPFVAERMCCYEYLMDKWTILHEPDYYKLKFKLPDLEAQILDNLSRPVILLCRGGSGSRLLSAFCQDLGLFLGNDLNISGDSLKMAMPIYQCIVDKYRASSKRQKSRIVDRLRVAGYNLMVESDPTYSSWGFKIPESILLLPELKEAFPNAIFIHLVRDPIDVCLRRTHMTARLDNCIGQICVQQAYNSEGIPLTNAITDSPALHMAYTTIHQLKLVLKHCSSQGFKKFVEIKFENLVRKPTELINKISKLTGFKRSRYYFEYFIDLNRIKNPEVTYDADVEIQVRNVLKPIRNNFGYILEEQL